MPADAYEAILRESPDLIVLDVLLGDGGRVRGCAAGVRANAGAGSSCRSSRHAAAGDVRSAVRGFAGGRERLPGQAFDPRSWWPGRLALSRLSALARWPSATALTRCYNTSTSRCAWSRS